MTQERTSPLGDLPGIPPEILERPGDFEEQLPFIKRTVSFVRQFEQAKPKGKEKLLEQLSATLVKDPKTVPLVFNNLDLINQIQPIVALPGISKEIKRYTEKETRKSVRQWTPDRIEKLVTIGLDNHGFAKEVISAMTEALFNAPKTPDEAVGLHYNAAWAMVHTKNEDPREELFSILCYEKEWFSATSECVFLFSNAAIFTTDSNIRKFAVVGEAITAVGKYLEIEGDKIPEKSKRANDRDSHLVTAPYTLPREEQLRRGRIYRRLIQQGGERTKILLRNFTLGPSAFGSAFTKSAYLLGIDFVNFRQAVAEHMRSIEEVRNYPYPLNLLFDDEPLRDFIRTSFHPKTMRTVWDNSLADLVNEGMEKITDRKVQVGDNLEIDIVAKRGSTPEQKNSLVREILETFLSGNCPNPSRKLNTSFDGVLEAASLFSAIIATYDSDGEIFFALSRRDVRENVGKLASIIEYHRPIITTEQAKAIETQIGQLRRLLQFGFTRSVGKRGYLLPVSDPALRELGYESIEFRTDPNTNIISTTLTLDGQTYKFDLSPEFRILSGDTIQEFSSMQDDLWLQLLTLSHLKMVICTEKEDIEKELVDPERQYAIYTRQSVLSRAETLRHLHPGQRFSQTQYGKCLKSELQVKDLVLINKMKAILAEETGNTKKYGGTLETGLWTYVIGYEREPDTRIPKPIKVAFKNASVDIRKVIPLSEFSQEEVDRVEREILEELEKI